MRDIAEIECLGGEPNRLTDAEFGLEPSHEVDAELGVLDGVFGVERVGGVFGEVVDVFVVDSDAVDREALVELLIAVSSEVFSNA